jgi:hypothetical protein
MLVRESTDIVKQFSATVDYAIVFLQVYLRLYSLSVGSVSGKRAMLFDDVGLY